MSNLQYVLSQAHSFADTYTTYTTTTSSSGGYSMGQSLLFGALGIFIIVCMWKVYTKAKQPGWAAIVPIYNIIIELRIVRRPWWWVFLMLIPLVNLVVAIIVLNDLSKAFGKGVGMTLLLLFLPIIGYPILAFGDATYQPKLLQR